MTDIVSHDTNAMREWSQNIETKSNDYDDLVNKFYAIVDQFVGSPQFKGGLSEEFFNVVMNQRNTFMQYSDTFRECAKYMNTKSSDIDSDEAQMKSMFNRANPLD
jgi:uncharacterized protein YukE